MSNEDRTKPIRELMGTLDGQPKPRPKRCGGAIVRVTRDSQQALARRFNVDWATIDLPEDGSTGEARVLCDDAVLEKVGVAGHPVQLATCARCAGIEDQQRATLAELAARQVH